MEMDVQGVHALPSLRCKLDEARVDFHKDLNFQNNVFVCQI